MLLRVAPLESERLQPHPPALPSRFVRLERTIQLLKINLVSFLRGTTFHGVSEFASSQRSLSFKLFWGLVISAMVYIFVYQLQSIVESWFQLREQPSVTYYEKQVTSLMLPVITVCSSHPISRPGVLELQEKTGYHLPGDLVSYMAIPALAFYTTDSFLKDRKSRNHFDLLYHNLTQQANMNVEEIFSYISMRCEEFILSCKLPGKKLMSSTECCRNLFNSEEITIYGRCLSTRNVMVEQYNTGPNHRLQIRFRFESGAWLGYRILNYFSQDMEIPIYVTHKNINLFVSEATLSIIPESYNEVHLIERTKDMRDIYQNAYNICHVDSNSSTSTFMSRFAETCPLLHDELNKCIRQVACAPLFFRKNHDESMVFCTPEATLQFIEICGKYLWQMQSACNKPCFYYTYFSNTIIGLYDRDYLEMMKKVYHLESSENYTEMVLFYPKLVKKIFKYQSASLSELLSDIGGNLSLTTGGSILSIMELAIFLATSVGICLSALK